MFGTSGVRGRVGETITADLALDIGRALVTDGADTVVLGRDARESGRTLSRALSAGVTRVRRRRDRRGRPADTDRRAERRPGRADAGVVVTASHTTRARQRDQALGGRRAGIRRRRRKRQNRRIVEEAAFNLGAWDELGEHRHVDGARERHERALRESVAIPDDLSVVVDLGNGVGRVTADALHATGCDVETLNAQRDGRFPGRPSEPTAENCQTACVVVEATDADLGIVHDGDADRMMAIDERGQFVSGDALLALFGRREADAGDRVAVPVDTSLLVADTLAEVGADVTYTPVGDAYVAETANPGVVFGGEPSGAWIWPSRRAVPTAPSPPARWPRWSARRIAVGDGRRASRVPDSAGFGADGRRRRWSNTSPNSPTSGSKPSRRSTGFAWRRTRAGSVRERHRAASADHRRGAERGRCRRSLRNGARPHRSRRRRPQPINPVTPSASDMYGVVLAAGRGTRMRPLTDRRPKPLLPVGDRSLLERVFDTVAGVVDEFVVVVGYRGDAIRDAIGESYRSYPVHYVEQAEALGTAHAVAQVEPVVDDNFLVLNGDVVVDASLPRSLADAEGTAVAATEVVDPRAYGVLSTTEDGSLAEIVEKPDDPPTNLANVGCYAFTPEVFEYIDRTPESERGEYEITTTIELLLDDGHPIDVAPYGDVARRRSPLGASGSQRTGAREAGRIRRPDRRHGREGVHLHGPVVIEEGALVRSGAYIEGPALIREGAEVGPNAYVRGRRWSVRTCTLDTASR